MLTGIGRSRERLACLLAAAWLVAGPAAAQECAPWPGEPARLSRAPGEEVWVARWRELRIEDLAVRARALEPRSPVESHLLWRRILCLDPWDERAKAGAERTRPLRVHRPELRADEAVPPPEAGSDPWQQLGEPLRLASLDPPRSGAAPPRTTRAATAATVSGSDGARTRKLDVVDGLLVSAESMVRAGRYDEALSMVAHARMSLGSLSEGADRQHALARSDLVAAEAELGRGREDAARMHLSRALRADPGLAPDPSTASPRLIDLWRALRGGSP